MPSSVRSTPLNKVPQWWGINVVVAVDPRQRCSEMTKNGFHNSFFTAEEMATKFYNMFARDYYLFTELEWDQIIVSITN